MDSLYHCYYGHVSMAVYEAKQGGGEGGVAWAKRMGFVICVAGPRWSQWGWRQGRALLPLHPPPPPPHKKPPLISYRVKGSY